MPDLDFLGPVHLGAVFLVKRPHLFSSGSPTRISSANICCAASSRRVYSVKEASSKPASCKRRTNYLRAADGLAGLLDLLLHRWHR